jgi:hypothetical protein
MIFGTRGFSRAGNPNFEVVSYESCHGHDLSWMTWQTIKCIAETWYSAPGVFPGRGIRISRSRVMSWSWLVMHDMTSHDMTDSKMLLIDQLFGSFFRWRGSRISSSRVMSCTWHVMHDMINYTFIYYRHDDRHTRFMQRASVESRHFNAETRGRAAISNLAPIHSSPQ